MEILQHEKLQSAHTKCHVPKSRFRLYINEIIIAKGLD
nr:MAG TPA: hypothetical protein [Caudoviricetes sp.]